MASLEKHKYENENENMLYEIPKEGKRISSSDNNVKCRK